MVYVLFFYIYRSFLDLLLTAEIRLEKSGNSQFLSHDFPLNETIRIVKRFEGLWPACLGIPLIGAGEIRSSNLHLFKRAWDRLIWVLGARDEVELMRRRARVFLETAKYLSEKGNHDVAIFNAEQAAQLYLKSTLLELVGDYPRTHSIIFLLKELERTNIKEVSEFIREDKSGLHNLEDSYLTSRYFYKSFDKEDSEYLISLAEKVVKLCEDIRCRLGKS